jgi:DeoR family fructose operon transcriptional repressor
MSFKHFRILRRHQFTIMSLLAQERQNMILQLLDEKGKVYGTDLATHFHVTPETIRRDLFMLEQDNKLRRVHGGAIKKSEPRFEQKQNMMYEEKSAIGKKAASFIEDGDIIVIDVGTTTLHLAKNIKGIKNLTIVTNSIAAANELNGLLENNHFEGKVIVLGGSLNPYQKSLSGTLTSRLLSEFRFDKAFISCGGINLPEISDFDMEESIASSMMIKHANRVFLLADSSKVDNQSFFRICDISDIHYVISDNYMPKKWQNNKQIQHLNWLVAKGD